MKQLKNNLIVYKHKMLVENSQEMIIFFDADGTITECNTKAIKELGYGDEIYHIPINEIFKKAFQYKFNRLETNIKNQINPEETIAYRMNQTCFPVELKVEIIREKNLYVGLCTAINISDKKEIMHEVKNLRNELKSFHQINSEITANITHELRTPVNGIMGLIDNLLETELNQDQFYDVNLIKRCCNSMNTIIDDLLDYAKISNDKLLLEQREFSFHDFISNIVEYNKKNINDKGLNLLVDISKDIPDRVIGDEFRLSQILNNLFSNATKFTMTGHIALEVIKTAQTMQSLELFFVLIDSGIGISLEEKDKLFKSFSQVDGSISRRFGGTGLGLSISKKLIEAMHGSIAVDSEKEKGSTFSFSVRLGIPKCMQDATTSLEMDKNRIGFENSNKLKIDNGFDIDYLKQLRKEENVIDSKMTSIKSMMETIKDISLELEKLTICIEMENWNKGEELATYINNLVPVDHGEITKNVFRLLLAVRKENRDASLVLLDKLKTLMLEVM